MIRDILNKLSVTFAAGCFSGLLNSLVIVFNAVWGLGTVGWLRWVHRRS